LQTGSSKNIKNEMNLTDDITVKLDKNEALVLFDFLSRLNDKEVKEIFEDKAEEKVLWILQGNLEKQLIESFKPNYNEIISEARNNVRDEE
jgi:hypothetical protein